MNNEDAPPKMTIDFKVSTREGLAYPFVTTYAVEYIRADIADGREAELRKALARAGNIICGTCEDTCPCDGGESPCDETKFIEQALKGNNHAEK